MAAGQLDRRITIKEPAITTGPYNEKQITGWTQVCETWADVEIGAGSEGYSEGQEGVSASATFLIRYRTGLDATMRITYEDEDYQIQFIEEVGRRHMLRISADYVEGFSE
ncbi:MAG TPA: phage head closure protein [bacterium]|nr:phage head closure protein [bacterium]